MESANLHPHRKFEEQYVNCSCPDTHQTGHQVSAIDEWNPSLFSNIGSKYNRHLNETIPKSRDSCPPPLIRPSMNQASFNQQSASGFLPTNIKDQMSDSFPKLSEMMYCHSSAEDSYLPPKKQYCPQSSDHPDLGGNLWHGNFSIANHMTELQLSSGELYGKSHHSPCLGTAAATSRYDFNDIFPSTNISTSDLCSTLFSTSLDLNLKALDLLTSTYGGGNCNQSFLDSPGKLSRSVLISRDHRRELSRSPSTSSKISASGRGSITTSTKRPGPPGSFSETKESPKDVKKHRSSMSRSPCPTLKVRKEKLGDRIAALQKLVAPFGKTDTASVLTEAIGYIQFLHDQVQTLSVPFMKSSQSNKLFRTVQVQGSKEEEEGKDEQKRDLRSRGLCLVHQSYASYFIHSCSSGI